MPHGIRAAAATARLLYVFVRGDGARVVAIAPILPVVVVVIVVILIAGETHRQRWPGQRLWKLL